MISLVDALLYSRDYSLLCGVTGRMMLVDRGCNYPDLLTYICVCCVIPKFGRVCRRRTNNRVSKHAKVFLFVFTSLMKISCRRLL